MLNLCWLSSKPNIFLCCLHIIFFSPCCILFSTTSVLLDIYLTKLVGPFNFVAEALLFSNNVSIWEEQYLACLSLNISKFFACSWKFNNYSFNILLPLSRSILLALNLLISSINYMSFLFKYIFSPRSSNLLEEKPHSQQVSISLTSCSRVCSHDTS